MELSDPALLSIDTGDAATFRVVNPATGATLARVPLQGADAAARAIELAATAQPGLRALPATARAAMLQRFAVLMREHAEDLSRVMTAEQGKPLSESRAEVAYGAAFFDWFAGEAPRVYGRVVPPPDASRRVVVTREPVGVTAAITPWNFPSAMIARKLAPALATGCTMVLKPAEATPLSALALLELGRRAGVPAGAFQVVTTDRAGADAVGRVLCESPVVRKLSFTGSTAVGRLLAQRCAATIKKVSLELGGNAPFLVFDDADVEAAVEGAMIAKFRNCGQTCVAANRFLVQEGVYEAFRERLSKRMAALRLGPGDQEGVELGPLIDQAALTKVQRLLSDARDRGARITLGGSQPALGGSFHEATLIEGITPAMALCQEEIFGPVAALTRFGDEAEGIALANDSRAGLCAYFYARDVGRCLRVADALEYGMVGANTGLISNAAAPFGGMKESGLGREGGAEGIEDWLETKYTCFQL